MEPTQFGNYTLIERISHGGMAEVYRAKSFGEAGFEREVALKLLLPSMASDSEFINMLIDEAKIAGQLNHANIAQIFDLGVTDGRYYIVQEYVSGQDLRAILQHRSERNTPLDVSTSCHIALKICEGLYYAHNKQDPSGRPLNLVHRDISPHNILISNEGEIKIIDFGIAKAEGRSTQTMAGLVKGKFAYMSPEQIRGLPVDHRSDVFATGILLHEMLTNQSLFRRSSEFETLKRARSATAEAPSKFNPRVPPALDKITLKALARHVDDRYQSALELRDALWAFAREHNSFSESNAFARATSKEGTGSSIEIELASEVSKITQTRSGDESHDYSYDLDDDGEVEDSEPGSATMVDPRLPFGAGSPDDEETTEAGGEEGIYTPTDHDAQWARDVGGPLSSASPYAMPTLQGNERRTKKLATVGDEETTSDRGGKQEAQTDRFSKQVRFSLDESTADETTAEGVAGVGESTTGVSDTAVKAAAPSTGKTTRRAPEKRESPMAVAATQSLAQAVLGQAPTQAIHPITPTPPTATQRSGLQESRPPLEPRASSAAPAMQTVPYPAIDAREPDPVPLAQGTPNYSQPAQLTPDYPESPPPPAYPPGYSQQGYGVAPYPAPGYPQAGYPQQGHSGGYYTPPQSSDQMPAYAPSDQSAPYPYPYPSADSMSGPFPGAQAGSESMVPSPSAGLEHGQLLDPRRLYLVMTAVFVLLLAGAATITLVVTG